MNWIKIGFFLFTYILLIYFSKGLIINSYESVTNMFGYVNLSNELNNIFSLIVELVTLGIVAILFFIPIGKDNSINLHYYINHAYLSLENYFDSNDDPDIKSQKAISALYNIVIYIAILIGYIWLISSIANTENGLMALILLLLSYFFINFIDFLTNIVKRIDKLEKDTNNTSFLSKKNIMTFVIITLIFIFLGTASWLASNIYNVLQDLPLLNLFDADRINTR